MSVYRARSRTISAQPCAVESGRTARRRTHMARRRHGRVSRRRSTGCRRPRPQHDRFRDALLPWAGAHRRRIGRATRVSTWRRRSGFERRGPPRHFNSRASSRARDSGRGAATGAGARPGVSSRVARRARSKSRCSVVRAGNPRRASAHDRWQAIDPAEQPAPLRTDAPRRHRSGSLVTPGCGRQSSARSVDQYLAIGDYADCARLARPQVPGRGAPEREVGAVSRRSRRCIAYYRGFARAHVGGSTSADYALAATLPSTYVFPNRRSSYRRARRRRSSANPSDATARFLSGLAVPGERPARTRDCGVAARSTGPPEHPDAPSQPRTRAAPRRASTIGRPARFSRRASSRTARMWTCISTLDGVLSAANASPRDRVAALRRFPSPERMPASMVFKLALALAEAGDARAAEALFHHRFFPQEEGGTSVRTVYAQVRLDSSRTAAAAGDCGTARDILDSLHARTAGPRFHGGRTCRHAAASEDGPPGSSRRIGRAPGATPRSHDGSGSPKASTATEVRWLSPSPTKRARGWGYHEPRRTSCGSKRRSRPRRGRWNQAGPATRGRSSTRARCCLPRWAGPANRASPSGACSFIPIATCRTRWRERR